MCSSMSPKQENRTRIMISIGSFSNDDGNRRETSLKINTGQTVTIFDCPILFVFCIVGKVRYKWIGVPGVKLNTENNE